jgi:branched-subunit amino acid ABC-type transport system permease component
MNRVLYLLTGGCVGGTLIAAYFGKVAVANMNENELIAAILLSIVYAAVCVFFIYTRHGKACRAWFDERLRAGEDKVRRDIREKGKVPSSWWPPL